MTDNIILDEFAFGDWPMLEPIRVIDRPCTGCGEPIQMPSNVGPAYCRACVAGSLVGVMVVKVEPTK